MAKVAVLGTGLLGRGFAENLLEKGHTVSVWNRTASKAAPLADHGASVANTPAEAVAEAERVHLILSEDPAVDAVISALQPGLSHGVPILDHSTNRPDRVAARYQALRDEGIRYLHAPVFMAPANARQATGMMLVCGPSEEVGALLPALEQMTGRVLNLGEQPERAAVVKLTGNGMLFMLTAAMGDLFRLGQAHGLPAEEVIGLFEAFSPTPAAMGKRLLRAGTGPASFELSMGRKDCRLMIESAGGPENLDVLPAVAAAMDRALSAGHAEEDFAIFAKLSPRTGE